MTTAALQDMFLPRNRCFGRRPANPDGLHLKSDEQGDVFEAEWVPEEKYERPPGRVNGGIMAVPRDGHATWAAMHAFGEACGGEPVGAVTAGYSVRLRRPTPIGHRVTFTARVSELDDRHATVAVEGDTVASFEGHFVVVDLFEYEG